MGGIYEMKKPKKINSFSITIFLLVVTLGYFGYFIIPVWWPIFQETGIMKGVCNDMYREYSNDKLMKKLLKETARTGLKVTKENFLLQRVPYAADELFNLDKAVVELRTQRGKECRLSFSYVSDAQWPFLGKSTPIEWNRSVKTDLKVVL